MRCFWLLTLSVFLTGFTVAAAEADDASVVRFGVCLPLTGEFGASGRKALAGVKLRLRDFNAEAERHGFSLEMVVRDSRSNPDVAAAIVREFAEKENLPAIIGPLSTNLMLSMREVALEYGIVMISPSVTSPLIGNKEDIAFRVLFDDAFQGAVLARYLRKTLGISTAAAFVNDHLAYSVSMFDAFKDNFEKLGGRIVAVERYNWVADEDDSFDFIPPLERIAAADPEIIFLPVNSSEIASIVRASTLGAIPVSFCGGDTWLHRTVLSSSGNNLDGAFFISGLNYASDSAAMEHFRTLYDRSNDPDAAPGSVLGYDALSLLIEGLKNGRDSEAIREGLYNLKNFELASGLITIDRKRGTEKTAFVQRVRKLDGEFRTEVVDEINP